MLGVVISCRNNVDAFSAQKQKENVFRHVSPASTQYAHFALFHGDETAEVYAGSGPQSHQFIHDGCVILRFKWCLRIWLASHRTASPQCRLKELGTSKPGSRVSFRRPSHKSHNPEIREKFPEIVPGFISTAAYNHRQ